MPLTDAGIYYADTSTNMSIADITAAMATSVGGALTVLQIVHASTSSPVDNTTNSEVNTGLSATITPSSTTSKVLVLVTQGGCVKSSGNANSWLGIWLYRNATALERQLGGYTGFSSDNYFGNMTFNYLDTPATTSAVTYKTTFYNLANASTVRVQDSSTPSHITLLEIAA